MSNPFQGKRVLITGGIGFLGSNLAEELANRGAEVLLVDSMIPRYGATLDNLAEFRDRVEVNFSDLRDSFSTNFLVRGHDYIFSLAGQVSHLESMHDPLTDLDINCRSQLSLLESCRLNNPEAVIVFAGTRQIYGKPQFLPVTEDHPVVPADANGVSNLATEHYFSLYHRVYNMRTVSLRLTNTYGPRMDLDSGQKGFMGVFIRRALRGEMIQLFGDGEQKRDFNYCTDVVDAFLRAASTGDHLWGNSYNLGDSNSYSLRHVVELLQQHAKFDFRCVPFPADRKAIDIGDYIADFSRFNEATGWTPNVSFEEGLAMTMKYFRTRTKRWSNA
ncbi:NAD-dependent epimerase/dehydratase family protein [Novipirellula sp. SH528]|uniref:NAD-dependent epimerase/dehydratase family protein n=1 Tax=Novipirellula sp. SH528 TaxID=3454466 RepID=UPI003FA0198C